MPIIEGLDNTGKNTLAAVLVAESDVIVNIHEFPDRKGLWGEEICKFLTGEIPHSEDVETWFLENRMAYYQGTSAPRPGDIVIRSGISFLVYKWYRSGVEPTEEEYQREAGLLGNEPIIYLDVVYQCPETKNEIYDKPDDTRNSELDRLFKAVIGKIKLLRL